MHFGKPMVVLPIFWDQPDNAQRVDETGFGARLPTYSFGDDDLAGAIDRLLDDRDLDRRLGEVSRRLQERLGNARAAELIEHVARTAERVAG
jgi:UDP:flavonoid glycosyltransferase YjiC (YdhE family)